MQMLNKTFHAVFILILGLFLASPAHSCIGRILYIGATNTDQEKLMSEMLALLINERTGTSVKIRYFDTNDQVYEALKSNTEEERVDIIVEDTADAAAFLKQTLSDDIDKEYQAIKKEYEQKLNIIWLNPFGFTNNKPDTGRTVSAPLVRRDVLTNFPLLPRILNKLSGAINDATFQILLDKVDSGRKPKSVAKDFLRVKKLI